MTTIHAYTNDQVLTDVYHEDLRRARSATHIDDPDQDRRRRGGRPRAAGAERQARRFRDPRADDQRVARRPDVRSPSARPRSRKSTRLKEAAEGALKGILEYNDEPLVSVDFNHNPASSIVRRDADQGVGRHAGEGLRRGTTTSGASRTACSTRRSRSRSKRAGRVADERTAARGIDVGRSCRSQCSG